MPDATVQALTQSAVEGRGPTKNQGAVWDKMGWTGGRNFSLTGYHVLDNPKKYFSDRFNLLLSTKTTNKLTRNNWDFKDYLNPKINLKSWIHLSKKICLSSNLSVLGRAWWMFTSVKCFFFFLNLFMYTLYIFYFQLLSTIYLHAQNAHTHCTQH